MHLHIAIPLIRQKELQAIHEVAPTKRSLASFSLCQIPYETYHERR